MTAQELDASLAPTGKQYTYQTASDFGTFDPTSTFGSQYIGVSADGYYFDEAANSISSGPVTLTAYCDLSATSLLNVNLLSTLAHERIQNLVTKSHMSFAAAQSQAQAEVLAAFNIRSAGNVGSFNTLDISKSGDGDKILAAVSSLFVFGNTPGNLSQLIANFQSDLGANGVITSAALAATLKASAAALNPAAIAANLSQKYASQGVSFTAVDISNWIDADGDGVVGKFKFQVPNAGQSSTFTFPASLTDANSGGSIAVSAGKLSVNGNPVTGAMTIKTGDVVAVSPLSGTFPNGTLSVYLLNGSARIGRVTFISGLASIAVTPSNPSLPLGLTERFTATGTFTDGSSQDITSGVQWASSAPAAGSIGASGVATGLTVGQTNVTATSGTISGSTNLSVVAATLQSIAVTPNPFTTGVGIARRLTATGTFSDGSKVDITASATWSSSAMAVATVTAGMVGGAAAGSTTITATSGGTSANSTVSVTASNTWNAAGSMNLARAGHEAVLFPSGKVLVMDGALGGSAVSDSFESYDLLSDMWSLAGSAGGYGGELVGRTGTLLNNGKVLLAGGTNDPSQRCSAGVLLYDPASQTLASANSMPPSVGHTATLLPSGKVLVVGGICQGAPVQPPGIFDPSTGTWSATANMIYPRFFHTATLLADGRVLIAGGVASATSQPATAAEIYDPTHNTWSAAGTMSSARYSGQTATLLPDGRVLVAGGSVSFVEQLPSGQWSTGAAQAAAEIYDPNTNSWSTVASMITARTTHTATLFHEKVLIVGGASSLAFGVYGVPAPQVYSSTEIFDPAAGTWSSAASVSMARARHAATLLPNNTVLVTGGATDGSGLPGAMTKSSELYW